MTAILLFLSIAALFVSNFLAAILGVFAERKTMERYTGGMLAGALAFGSLSLLFAYQAGAQ